MQMKEVTALRSPQKLRKRMDAKHLTSAISVMSGSPSGINPSVPAMQTSKEMEMSWLDQAPQWMREQLEAYAHLAKYEPVLPEVQIWAKVSRAIHEAISEDRPYTEVEAV